MTTRPDDQICTVCGATITPYWISFRAEWRFSGCPVCAERERKETERRDFIAALDAQIAGINNILLQRGVGRCHAHATLEDFGSAYQALHVGDGGVFVFGPRGTGKTHLMSAIMRAMILDHLRAARQAERRTQPSEYPFMVSTTDLLREIRATFNGNGPESESTIVERYGKYPVLMLDDIGAEQSTDWALTVLHAIIDLRYRDLRRTFVTSNLSLSDLSAQTSDRITSRLAEMCRIVRCAGPDRRLTK